ncbi:MAG: DUF2378 family protein [Myxococcaceae bacterium]|nr:DUF2378 family protein [Myxococcaceae bacterium]
MKSDDSSQWVWFRPAVETHLHLLKAAASPELARRVEALGLSLDGPPPDSVTHRVYEQLISLAVAAVVGGPLTDASLFEYGSRAANAFYETEGGRALLSMVRLDGPQRFVTRTPSANRTVNNFTDVGVVARGEATYELTYTPPALAFASLGGVAATLGLLGAKKVSWSKLFEDEKRVRVQLSWQ